MSNKRIMVHIQPALNDNLSYLVFREGQSHAVVIDPSEARPVRQAAKDLRLQIGGILNTHHHHDHVGGNKEIMDIEHAPIWCSSYDKSRIEFAARGLMDKEEFTICDLEFVALHIPGHTQGQVAFYLPEASAIFVGDTLFSLGCGRLMEGTAEQMWKSLNRLMQLPADTKLYFGHEYTQTNAQFALSLRTVEPMIVNRLQQSQLEISQFGVASPPTIAQERLVNPFLRPMFYAVELGATGPLEAFAALRIRRDGFNSH